MLGPIANLASGYIDLAEGYVAAKDYGKAIKSLEKALRLSDTEEIKSMVLYNLAVTNFYLDKLAEQEFGKLYAVHRIDKDTSGCVIYAKNAESHRNLSLQFENRKVTKVYHCLINGHPLWQSKTVDIKLNEKIEKESLKKNL